jgi:hypothetical protein
VRRVPGRQQTLIFQSTCFKKGKIKLKMQDSFQSWTATCYGWI